MPGGEPAVAPRPLERERHARGGRVAERADAVDEALGVDAEPLRERGEDPRVRLVVDEQVDLVEFDARGRHADTRRLGEPPHRLLERLVAVHREEAASRGRRRSAPAWPPSAPSATGPISPGAPAVQRIAPAPSPNSAAVLRSSGSTWRDMISAPITSACCEAPDASIPARRRARRGSRCRRCRHRTLRRRSAPIACATWGAAFGITESWLHDATSTRSRSAPSTRASASAAIAAARGELGERARRVRVAPLADPGPPQDPVGVDADRRRDLVVGDDAVGQRAADADDRPLRSVAGAAGAGVRLSGQRHRNLLDRDRLGALDVARDQLREDLVRADVDEALGAELRERRHRLAPADRRGQRSDELGANVGERCRRQPGEHRDRGLAQLDRGERLAEGLLRGGHPRRVEGAGDVERERANAALAPDLHRALQPLARAGEHDLAGCVVVRDPDARGLGDLRRDLGGAAQQREHAAVAARAARLVHQAPAQHDELERRPRSSARPPRRAPTARRASARRRRARRVGPSSSTNAARLERKIAGCANRVESPARSKQSSPISSSASSRSDGSVAGDALARARDRYPLPGEQQS